jgi:hypothetical protein
MHAQVIFSHEQKTRPSLDGVLALTTKEKAKKEN